MNPQVLPTLPPNTIIPQNWDLFIPYLYRLYEDIAFNVNNRDYRFFNMTITSTAQNILLLPQFGAYIICVSGMTSTLPTITASLCKSDSTASGSIAVLGHQAGTGAWNANILTITSTSTNFQIAHNNTGVNGAFNIRIIGTQQIG
jgi:hypothetical protein